MTIEEILTTKKVGQFLTFTYDPFGKTIQVAFGSHFSNRDSVFPYRGKETIIQILEGLKSVQRVELNKMWLQDLIDDLKQ